jgi:hypothetical protein
MSFVLEPWVVFVLNKAPRHENVYTSGDMARCALNLSIKMEVSCLIHAPVSLLQEMPSNIHWTEGSVGHRAGMNVILVVDSNLLVCMLIKINVNLAEKQLINVFIGNLF